MTTTSRPPPSAPTLSTPLRSDKGSSRPGPLRAILIALVACGLVVAPAFAFHLAMKDDTGSSAGDVDSVPLDNVRANPAAYTANAVERVAALSTVDVSGTASTIPGVGPTAAGLVAGAEAEARASLDAAIAAAFAALEEALANTTLPAIPLDYLPGAPIDVRLPTSLGYVLPALPGGPALESFAGETVEVVASPVGSRQSSSPLEDALAQVQDVQSTLEGVLGELPTGDLLSGLPLNGLPIGTGAPTQAQDAGDAVEPDEEGALLADRHATALLGATSAAYSETSAELKGLVAAYQTLAVRLEEAIELTKQIQEDGNAEIQATLDERLASIDRDARSLTAQATRLVAEHNKLVGKAGDQANAAIRLAVNDQLAAIEQVRAEAVGNVSASIQKVLADAESRKASVRALVGAATADLGKVGASEEALYGLDAIRAAGTAAILKIERDAKADVLALGETRTVIDAQAAMAQRHLNQQVVGAFAKVNGTVAGALEGTVEVREYLVAVAEAQAQALEDREIRMAGEAIAKLDLSANKHVTKMVRAALASTGAAETILDSTTALVGTVEQMATGEVGKDLDYIAKVSQDYGRVPTDDRKERASHWSATAGTLDGLLGDALVQGQSVERLARQAVSAAGQAQADIEAMI